MYDKSGYASAAQVLKKALKKYKNLPELYFQLIKLNYKEGNQGKIKLILEEIQKENN